MNLAAIPAELTERKQWCRWKPHNGTKLPICYDGTVFKSNDETTWSGFSQVESFDRIAFVISESDPYTGIDLDGCLIDGEFTEWSKPIVEAFQGVAYGEVSPSGNGVKLITRAKKPKGSRCTHVFGESKQQVECYDFARFWTITANVMDGFEHIGDGQAAVDWLCSTYLAGDTRHTTTKHEAASGGSFSLLQRAHAYTESMRPAAKGGLRNAAFQNAGHLHAFVGEHGERLSDSDVYHLLRSWNARNSDPLRDSELMEAAKNGRKNGTPPADKPPVEKTTVGRPKATSVTRAEDVIGLYDLSEDSGRTDAANAVRFIGSYADKLLHVPPWRKWLAWDGKRWLDDSGVAVQQRAKRYAEGLWSQLGDIGKTCDRDELGKVQTFIKRTNERAKIRDFIELASTDPRIVCHVDELNANPMLLNCSNGTIDLRTGELRKHSSADRITQLAPVDYEPSADCSEWLKTLDLIFDGDAELIRYVQQLLGYSISGDTGEAILPIAYGSGCNGKSTIWNAMNDLLGDYAAVANDDLLLGERANHQTEKASLYQKRFVAISEPEKNASLRESRVKELTGDRTITARRMHEDFWSFERTHTFWLSTNHLPRIDGTDEGIWRRVKLIPFSVDLRTKVNPIADFDQWLVKNEGPGILAWLVRGFQDWRTNGFIEPSKVTNATRNYRDNSDALGEFLAECCVVGDRNAVTLASDLFKAYSEVFQGRWSKTAFG